MKAERVSFLGLLISLSLVLSYIESLIPFFPMFPGIRIGLANTVVLFALYKRSFSDSLIISIFKCLISGFLFGSLLSFLYSVCGSAVSLMVMYLLRKTSLFNTVAVSTAGAVCHNMSQLCLAVILLETGALVYYIPVLVLAGAVAGIITGLITEQIIKRV